MFTVTLADFCSGIKTLTAESGTVAAHDGLGSYPPETECQWYISPQLASGRAADQVVLTVTKLVPSRASALSAFSS